MANHNWSELNEILKGFIMGKVKDPILAEDLLQETLIKIHLNIRNLRHEAKLINWAFQIARNVIIDHYKKQKKESEQGHMPDYGEIQCDESTFNKRIANWIPEAIKLLPEKYREAIYLTEIEGLTQKEMAEKLGLSYSGAKSRVQRGREKLKEIILQCCQVVTDSYGNVIDFKSRAKEREKEQQRAREKKKKKEECCD